MTIPRRIVSLVPSLSETVCDFGLRESLVGCTHFCIEPKDLHRTAQAVGGTKDPDLDLIRSLRPTHILANQEENVKDAVLALAREFSTLITYPRGPLDVPDMLRSLGSFLDSRVSAETWAQKIEEKLSLKARHAPAKFLYLIWQNPYMAAGQDTYISRSLERLGLIPSYQGEQRYPILQIADMQACTPDILFLSSEPYPFRKRDAMKLREAWPEVPRMALIDGQMLSWFGTRTLKALEVLEQDEKAWLRDFN